MAASFTVNGMPVTVDAEGGSTLLLALRNELCLHGTRFGCGAEDCGACTVLIDGHLHYACGQFVEDTVGKDVETVEGLRGPVADALRQAFIEVGAGQCGYCLSGIFVSAYALLTRSANPSRTDIRSALSRNLCRCGAHMSILRGVERAATLLTEQGR
ncbi:(2Fe-2S)-binding protein [Bosea sp. NPDC055332]